MLLSTGVDTVKKELIRRTVRAGGVMLDIEVIDNSEKFLELEQEWNTLLKNSKSNTIFLTWEWLYNWWKIYKENKDLYILLVRESGKLVGIAPLFLIKIKYFNFLTIYQLKFLGSEKVGSDYLDFIIESGYEKNVIEAIFNFLQSKEGMWDMLIFTDFPSNSENLDYIQHYSQSHGYYFNIQNHTACPYVTLPNNWNELLGSLSKKTRYNLRRNRGRLEKDYKAEFEVVKERDKIDGAIYDLIRLNQMRMKSKRNNGVFYSEKFTEFHRNIIHIFLNKGLLRLCFIKVNGIPICVLYIFKYEQSYFYYQSGLDPAWVSFSPGMMLISYCIENAISEGMKEFDFLQGEEDYKYKWTSEHRKNMRIKIFGDSLKGRFIFSSEISRIKGKEIIKNILNLITRTIIKNK